MLCTDDAEKWGWVVSSVRRAAEPFPVALSKGTRVFRSIFALDEEG
jgi:hypothetical protein